MSRSRALREGTDCMDGNRAPSDADASLTPSASEVPELPNSLRQESLRAFARESGGAGTRAVDRWAGALRRREDQIADAWIDELGPDEREEVLDVATEVAAMSPQGAEPATTRAAEDDGPEAGGGPLPYIDQIQESFGAFDLSTIRARVGGAVADDLDRSGAEGRTQGSHIDLMDHDLWTAAHEAAHAVQQSAGAHLIDGEGRPGDGYEREADRIAERVVQGRSAEDLLEKIDDPGPILDRPQGRQHSGGLPDPPLSDEKLRGLSKEQLQELYSKMRKTNPQEALKVKRWQKSMEYRGSSVKKSGASKKSIKKATQEIAEEGGEEVAERLGKKIVKKGLGAVARKIPLIGIGFFAYDWIQGGFGHAVNELAWPVSELWVE